MGEDSGETKELCIRWGPGSPHREGDNSGVKLGRDVHSKAMRPLAISIVATCHLLSLKDDAYDCHKLTPLFAVYLAATGMCDQKAEKRQCAEFWVRLCESTFIDYGSRFF